MTPGQVDLIVTEISAGTAFGYKFLLDDTTWQTGNNSTGTAGQANTTTPSF